MEFRKLKKEIRGGEISGEKKEILSIALLLPGVALAQAQGFNTIWSTLQLICPLPSPHPTTITTPIICGEFPAQVVASQ